MAEPVEFLSPAQLCERIPGLTVESLAKARYRGTGAPFTTANAKVVLYDWHEYVRWLKSKERTQSSRNSGRS